MMINYPVNHFNVEAISPELDDQLIDLISTSFPTVQEFKNKSYCFEKPSNRWIIFNDELPVAHLATHDKYFRFEGEQERHHFCAIAEVCVAGEFRGKGLVGKLLDATENHHQKNNIPFSVLLGGTNVYEKYGYVPINKFYKIQDGAKENLKSALIKPMALSILPAKDIYYEGYSF